MASDKIELSPRAQKLAKDFTLIDGQYQVSEKKMRRWQTELEKVPNAERQTLAEELIALAMNLERTVKEAGATGSAQLFTLAAVVLRYNGSDAKKGAAKGETKPAAGKGAPGKTAKSGWSAKR